MINLKINDKSVSIEEGKTILQAANSVGVKIPTLCYLKDINAIGSCRICLVSVKGSNKLVASCVTPVSEGMEVYTDSDEVIKSRKKTLQLILSTHNKDCDNCIRNNNCELQNLFNKYKIEENVYKGANPKYNLDTSTSYLVRDNSKCILCNRCVATCEKVQKIYAIGKNNRGTNTHIGCAFDQVLDDVPCIACGQCINACPTGALYEKDDIEIVEKAIKDKNKYVIAIVAPAVRVAIGEEFGMSIGTIAKGKMVSSLKKLNFDKVFDITFGADLTIMEEGTEFINRLKHKKSLPMITSCSPGWIKYMEYYYPELINKVSTCKSPQQMCGATLKTYYAKKEKIDPKNMFVVAVSPCVAKKFERGRTNQLASGYYDVDAVITTRELARMIKNNNIDFTNLEDKEFDNPFGNGASVIFGASGGVMESALKTVYEITTKKPLNKVEYKITKEGHKEVIYNMNGKEIRALVVSGIGNAKEVLERIKKRTIKYDFIEIMTCPGGCINGGGQPIVNSEIKNTVNVIEKRTSALRNEQEGLPYRKAHENPDIKELYDNFFIEPGSKKAHSILHTSYIRRNKYKNSSNKIELL